MNNPFSLSGKVILITGASSGIGRRCAITCSESGAKCILVARNKERLKITLSDLHPGDHMSYSFDLNDHENIPSFIKEVTNNSLKIDGFIHSAGVELTKPLKITTYQDFKSTYDINVIAGALFIKELSKKINIPEEGASYIFISSIMGILGISGISAYSASKSAIISMVKSLALELASKKIRVNTILPGLVRDTPMTEQIMNILPEESIREYERSRLLGWVMTHDVANACLFLLSGASNRITGISLIVDSGYSCK